MEAGRYYGAVGSIMIQPARGPTALSRSGLAFRQNIVDDYLGRAGLTSRGDGRGTQVASRAFGSPSPLQLRSVAFGNICDGGAAGGAALTQAGQSGFMSQVASGAFTTQPNRVGAAPVADAGWQSAGGILDSLMAVGGTILGTVAASDCAALERARVGQTPTQTSTDPVLAQMMAQQQAQLMLAQQQAQADNAHEIAAANAAETTQRNMMIGGGILLALVAVGVGVAVLRK